MHAQLNTNSSACTIGYDFRAWWGARTSDPLINSHEHHKYCFSREYTENIGLMELHVIPNVCSEYSEQKIQANGRPYRTIIHST